MLATVPEPKSIILDPDPDSDPRTEKPRIPDPDTALNPDQDPAPKLMTSDPEHRPAPVQTISDLDPDPESGASFPARVQFYKTVNDSSRTEQLCNAFSCVIINRRLDTLVYIVIISAEHY